MSESSASRQPDPDRVARWRSDIEDLRKAVTELVMFRDDFEAFAEMVRGDARILHGSSPFPARVKAWYVDSQVMRIRRLVDQGGQGGDVRSLRLVLEDMKRAAEAFNRSNIEELFDLPDAPDYDAEMRDFLVSSMWQNAGDVANEVDRLYAKQIKDDLKALADASDRIKRYADKVVAHDTVEGLRQDDVLNFSEISACVDVISKITIRYIATLTGAGYSSLSPVAQYDAFDIFRFEWRPPA
jgi:hypothetical protein